MKKFNTSEGNERPCFYALDNGMKGHRVYLEEA